jgi:hypothetical protein
MNAPIISRNSLLVAQQSEDIPGLKAIHTRDQSGRIITSFTGSPRAWMNQFSGTPRLLKSIRTRSHA